jgi:glycosyltransferase involved in cell wall biosynthesis
MAALTAGARRSSSRPPRILVVGPVPPPLHGVTVMTAALLEGAVDPGLEMIHFDTSDHRSINNVGAFDVRNTGLALRHIARFVRTLWGARPDLVYLPLSQGLAGFTRDAAFLVTARLFSIRVVVHAHGAQYQTFYRRTPAVGRGLLRFCMARVHLIVVLAESLRREFDGWTAPPGGIAVVPNGIRDEWPGGPPRRTPQGGGTVLILGALIPQKGFLDVLDAAPIVLSAAPGVHFIFAGEPVWDAETAAHVLAARGRPEVEDATTFAGAVGLAERRRLLEEADVVVFAPRWDEGQGLVALEAMSAGLPLVATASGGLAETVRDGVEAIIVPRRDPQAIAAAITTLLQDPDLRASMGRAARERYEGEYTLDGWVRRMRALFEMATQRGSA